MGITIFIFFIWGGISSDILSEITFYDRISDNIPPQMKHLDTVIPLMLYEVYDIDSIVFITKL